MSYKKLSYYNFYLPKNLIAQKPAKPADSCRLLVLDKNKKTITDKNFLNLTDYLQPGDVLVFNNSKVIPARLIGKKTTGGKVEILLLKQINLNTWECLVGNLPIKKQINTTLSFSGSQGPCALAGTIISRNKDTTQIKFNLSGTKLMQQIFKIGQMPTPPYIKRLAKQNEYQNIFADPKKLGSVAAPTAGLHFTKRMFKKLKQKGVQIEFITLHVGLGTFAPIKEQDITKHQIHEEYFELNKSTTNRLNNAKKDNRRIIAVGTTSVRVLETCASRSSCHGEPFDKTQLCHTEHSRMYKEMGFAQDRHSRTINERGKTKLPPFDCAQDDNFLIPQNGFTSIYIYPGYKFKFIDALITNFHLPNSSLILLVSAFAGTKFIKKAYNHAIHKKYRFYSFGDVMIIK